MNTLRCDDGSRRIIYTNLDVVRFICSLLVIMIHTAPLVGCPVAHIYLCDIFCRVAVPLFFGISGFLLFNQMVWENGKVKNSIQNRSRMYRYLKRTAKLYLGWSCVYLAVLLPGWYASGWWGWTAIKDAVYALFLVGPFYHLWYLLALLWTVPMMYGLLCVVPLNMVRKIAAGLWLVRCLTNAYSWILGENLAELLSVTNKLSIISGSVFSTLPIMTAGAVLVADLKSRNIRPRIGNVLFWLCAWVVEASILLFLSPNKTTNTNLFSVPFFVYAALDYLLRSRQRVFSSSIQIILRDTSVLIYCIHPLLIHFLKQLGMESGLVLWGVVTVASMALSFAWPVWKHRDNTQR